MKGGHLRFYHISHAFTCHPCSIFVCRISYYISFAIPSILVGSTIDHISPAIPSHYYIGPAITKVLFREYHYHISSAIPSILCKEYHYHISPAIPTHPCRECHYDISPAMHSILCVGITITTALLFPAIHVRPTITT